MFSLIRSYRVIYSDEEKKQILRDIIIDTFSAYEKSDKSESEKNEEANFLTLIVCMFNQCITPNFLQSSVDTFLLLQQTTSIQLYDYLSNSSNGLFLQENSESYYL